jgi:hypothetical protein
MGWRQHPSENLRLETRGRSIYRGFSAPNPCLNTLRMHAFDREGLAWVRRCPRGGAPPRITADQRTTLCLLADQSPAVVGLPYGRWSLTTLRDHAVKHRIVRAISREHLGRVLENGGSPRGASSASSAALTRNGQPSCGGCVPLGGICRVAACSCSCNTLALPVEITPNVTRPFSCRSMPRISSISGSRGFGLAAQLPKELPQRRITLPWHANRLSFPVHSPGSLDKYQRSRLPRCLDHLVRVVRNFPQLPKEPPSARGIQEAQREGHIDHRPFPGTTAQLLPNPGRSPFTP